MAQPKSINPKGSIILKLLIVVFMILLLVSILTPQADWKAQEEERDQCRLQMENLSYAIREYGIKNLGYMDNLKEYIGFIHLDSTMIQAPRYDIESLTRNPESGKDSLLLDFTDNFRLSRFDIEKIREVTVVGDSILPDSMHIFAVPHPQFKKIPITTIVMTSQSPINVINREKNIKDHAVLIYSESQIEYDWMTPDPVLMKSTEALISIPADSLKLCATSGLPYKLNVNVRSTLEGSVEFKVNEDSVETNVTQDTLMVDLFNHLLKTEALAEVLVLVKEDSTLIDKKDSILVDKFIARVNRIENKETFTVNGDHTINVPADSMSGWDDSLRIKRSVFVAHVDSLSNVLKNIDVFQALTPRVDYQEIYKIAKVDTVGVTIKCPIDSLHHKTDRSFFRKIFGVSATRNHGEVENGDLSWSEKK